jgi:aspartokinase
MKQLILIAGMLLAMTAKLVAQDNKGIEVKSFQMQQNGLQKENHQFQIVAHENVDIDLKFSLKTEDNINVTVTDKEAGKNKLTFTMEEDQEYLVKLIGEKQSNLIVQVTEND